MVHILPTRSALTIGEYLTQVVGPHVLKFLDSNSRVDVVFDRYLPCSLKAALREERGTGSRLKVTPSTKMPTNWQSFLRVDLNNQELFILIARFLQQLELPEVPIDTFSLTSTCYMNSFRPQGKCLFTTLDEECLSTSESASVSNLSPCYQEEADSRIFLHVADAAAADHRRILIRANDSDVVALAVRAMALLHGQLETLWIFYGTGKKSR
jgi:hypothetical protein